MCGWVHVCMCACVHVCVCVCVFPRSTESGGKEVGDATSARRHFLRAYGLSEANGPPLLAMDLEKGDSAPFQLVQ
jgi:hypothetical protein